MNYVKRRGHLKIVHVTLKEFKKKEKKEEEE